MTRTDTIRELRRMYDDLTAQIATGRLTEATRKRVQREADAIAAALWVFGVEVK